MSTTFPTANRFFDLIGAANGLTAPRRAKLTRARIEKAFAYRAQWKQMAREVREISRPVHVTLALDFAATAIRAGKVVKVKFPDGARGSVYVRVGREAVRFADHSAPIELGQRVGGFSKRLNRRHVCACRSIVARWDVTRDGAEFTRFMDDDYAATRAAVLGA